MKSLTRIACAAIALVAGTALNPSTLYAASNFQGKVFEKVDQLKAQHVFSKKTTAFAVSSANSVQGLTSVLTHYTLLKKSAGIDEIKAVKPDYLSMQLPVDNGARNLDLLLYKVNISPNGFTLMSSDGQPHLPDNSIVHYRGIIDNNPQSVVSFSFSDNETMGLVSTADGNYVIGKIANNPDDNYIIYNDKDMVARSNFSCGTVPVFPVNHSNYSPNGGGGGNNIQTAKCVNWYWETDYDIFVDKGSVANVNSYMQGVFNQDAALYANDGINITLQTLYVWSTTDPYTGPGTGDYLNQFGNYRTSFAGDCAHLIGYNGGGGIAWVGGLCYSMPSGRQAYSAIYSTYSNVPAWSWTVECISHEEGHVLGSNHTHDCVWNGNNTAIDGCGPAAGYPGSSNGGTCVAGPIPTKGTIMSYCHLSPNPGIDLSLGFGIQPKTVIINAINAASCLSACGTGCSTPSQPGTISGTAAVCQGSSQTYSISAVSGATSYTWTLPSGWSGTSTTTSITVTAGATSGNISVTANNTCGASTARTLATTATALPAQPGTMTGNASVCSGSSQVYSVSAVSGATSYTWTKPSGWSGTSTTNSITATAGTAGGNMSVTANNGCGSGNARALAVAVSSTPAQPGTISGNTSVCPSSSQTYTVTAVSGATTYTWTMPSGWTGTSTTNTITVTAGSVAGNISVNAGNSCGTSSVRTLAVTMGSSAPAQPGTISGNAAVCPSTSQTYSVTPVSGATSYTWTKPNGWSGTSTTNSITLTSGSTGGTLSVVAVNGCGSSAARTLSLSMSTAPAQPGTITGSTSVCQSSSQTYSIAAVSGATSYTWTLPNGWSGTSSTTSISTTAGATGGTISVIAVNGCGSSTARTLTTTVSATASQPGTISGSTSVCASSSQTYSISAVNGATSYTWTLPGGWSGSSTSTSIASVAGSSGGTISVVANNGCGSSAARTLAATVSPLPAQPAAVNGNSTVCPGTSQTYSISAVSGATSYTWTLPNGWSGSSTTTSISPITGVAGGSVTVRANNGCGSSSAAALTVSMSSAVPSQPGTITGNATVCQSTSQTYSVTAVNGATSYTWTLPNGWTGTSSTNSISVISGTSNGNISVTANNGCGSSTARTLAVSISGVGPAQPGAINGNASVCQSSSQTYSIAAVNGATSYTWTLPNGWSGSSASTSITTTAGSTGGTISVVANNSCGSSAARTLSASVSILPALPGAITGGASVCQASSQIYSVAAVTGATSYTWTLPNGWSGTSGTNSITATIGSVGGTISVVANSGCGSSSARTLTATVSPVPVQPAAITGSGSVCSSTSQTYYIAAVNGASSYTWTLPNGWSGSSTSTSITTTAGTSGGNITVRANNGCGSSAIQSKAVTVNLTPAQPSAISGVASACPNSTVVYSVNTVNGATSYNWSLPTGWNGSSSTNSISVSAGTVGGTISVTAANGCGTSASQSMALSTATAPGKPGLITGTKTVCTGSQQTYSFTPVVGATSYSWTLPGGWSGTSNTNSITVTVGSTSGTLSVISVSGCGTSAARNKSLTVPKAIAQPGSITGNITLCTGASQIYSVTAVTNATSYLWSLPNGWTGSSTSNTISAVAGTSGGMVSVRAENACFVSSFRTVTAVVKPIPNPTVVRAGNNLVVSPVVSTDVLQWYYNGNAITGTNDTLHCLGTGTYSCRVTSMFGCSATSPSVSIFTCGAQPRMALAEPISFSLYPNPSQGAFTLSLPEGSSNATVEIYDPFGNLVFRQAFSGDDHQATHQLQLDVAKGIYFVNVREGEETTMQKLIIE